jgi:hypothetical protein
VLRDGRVCLRWARLLAPVACLPWRLRAFLGRSRGCVGGWRRRSLGAADACDAAGTPATAHHAQRLPGRSCRPVRGGCRPRRHSPGCHKRHLQVITNRSQASRGPITRRSQASHLHVTRRSHVSWHGSSSWLGGGGQRAASVAGVWSDNQPRRLSERSGRGSAQRTTGTVWVDDQPRLEVGVALWGPAMVPAAECRKSRLAA